MDHAYYSDRVSAFHDRELPAQEMVIVEEHIRGCAECQALLAEIAKLDALVARRAELAGGDFWDRSARSIERRLGFVEKTEVTSVEKARWDRGLVVKISAIAASLALLVFIGINRDKILRQDQVTPQYKTPSEVPAVAPADTAHSDSLTKITKQPQDEGKEQGRQPRQLRAVEKPRAGVSTDQAPSQQKGPSAGNYISERGAPDSLQPAPVQESEDLTTQTAPEKQDERVQPLPVEPGVKNKQLASGTAPQAPPESTTRRRTVRVLEDSAERAEVKRAPAAVQQSVQESAVADSAASTTSTDQELSLWRDKRDSLKDRLHTNETALLNKYSISSLIKKVETSNKLAARSALVPTASDRTAIEKSYLEACYHVALLTPSAREFGDARAVLQQVAAQRTSPNSGVAQQYLNELRANRPSPPQN